MHACLPGVGEFGFTLLFPVLDELDFLHIRKTSSVESGLAYISIRIEHAGDFTRYFPSGKRATD